MSHGHKICSTRRDGVISGPSPALLFFLLFALLPMPSVTQSVVHGSPTSTGLESATRTSTPTTHLPPSISKSVQSMTTSFTFSSVHNSTTSAATSSTTEDVTSQLFPGASSPSSDEERKENVFNYYFLFLAVFGVLTAVLLWWLHRRRKRRKEQMRLSGQNALARDLDGWVNTRRWLHGAWRHNQTAAFVRREEGLNERGEAPPPYQPKSDVTAAQETGTSHDPASGLSVPLRTLSRDNIEQIRPPEYRETISRGGASTLRPDTSTTTATRPETADVQPNSSTRDLVRNNSDH